MQAAQEAKNELRGLTSSGRPDGRATVANVSGLPGFINTRPKCTVLHSRAVVKGNRAPRSGTQDSRGQKSKMTGVRLSAVQYKFHSHTRAAPGSA